MVYLQAGCTSDGGSIASILWSLPGYQPFGPLWKWYFAHDAFYRGLMLDKDRKPALWERDICDKVLLEGAANTAADSFHRLTIYNAVRALGQSAFDKDRAEYFERQSALAAGNGSV